MLAHNDYGSRSLGAVTLFGVRCIDIETIAIHFTIHYSIKLIIACRLKKQNAFKAMRNAALIRLS